MSGNVHLSTRLQQVVAQHAATQPPAPRRAPFGLLAALLVLALLLGSVYAGWMLLSGAATRRPAVERVEDLARVPPAADPCPGCIAPGLRHEPVILATVQPAEMRGPRVLLYPVIEPTATPGVRPTATRALRGGPIPPWSAPPVRTR